MDSDPQRCFKALIKRSPGAQEDSSPVMNKLGNFPNFFLHDSPAPVKNISGVKTHKCIHLQGVFPGIIFHFSGHHQGLVLKENTLQRFFWHFTDSKNNLSLSACYPGLVSLALIQIGIEW